MEFLPANHFSIQELTAIYNQTRADYLVPMPMTAPRLAEYIRVYDINLETSCVAKDDLACLGLCLTGIRNQWGWITRLGVISEHRRHGIGRLLLAHCIEQLSKHKLSTVFLEVITGNTPAYQLFHTFGFIKTQRLLILKRPRGLPPPIEPTSSEKLTWLDTEQILTAMKATGDRKAWTNQPESLINTGHVQGLFLQTEDKTSGWISFERASLKLKNIQLGSKYGPQAEIAHRLLHHLHSRYSTFESTVENIPASSPYLDALWEHNYLEYFSRIEMMLNLDC